MSVISSRSKNTVRDTWGRSMRWPLLYSPAEVWNGGSGPSRWEDDQLLSEDFQLPLTVNQFTTNCWKLPWTRPTCVLTQHPFSRSFTDMSLWLRRQYIGGATMKLLILTFKALHSADPSYLLAGLWSCGPLTHPLVCRQSQLLLPILSPLLLPFCMEPPPWTNP